MERIELAAGRTRVRFAWAYHAREVRFEREEHGAFAPVFPETFSFHPGRHEPAELALQLEDLWADPRRLAPELPRRLAQACLRALFAAVPAYLERALDAIDARGLDAATRARLHGDALVLARVFERFGAEKEFAARPDTCLAFLHLRKLVWRTARELVRLRLTAERLRAYLEAAHAAEPSEAELLRAAEGGGTEAPLVFAAAAAFRVWLEDTCLDESNGAFEAQGSPFDSREAEVLDAVAVEPGRPLRRGRDLSPFLCRAGHRDCGRLLEKLEVWFLRQYDLYHAAAVTRHRHELRRAQAHPNRVLSHHTARTYLSMLGVVAAPYVAAAFVYERAAFAVDLAASAQVLFVNAFALWFLVVRFCWRKDLTLFHTSVPRIGAGIIVGYLPVFLIDEVWDLARRPWFPLGVIVSLLGFTTLLYLYDEVQRRIEEPREAFRRAGRLFLLGLVQSLLLGLIVTSLLGGFMAARAWGGGEDLSLAALRAATPPFLGELPRIVGLEPVVAFPTALLLMTFLAFFIGTFLQLLWEDLPITEPLGARPSGTSGIQAGTFRSSGGSGGTGWPGS